jgi:hypothetical protein
MSPAELADAIAQLDAKASKDWQVHRCYSADREGPDVACGICSSTGRHPCPPDHARYANVIGDQSYDECHHPASLVDMELAVLLRNHTREIVEALREGERHRAGAEELRAEIEEVKSALGLAGGGIGLRLVDHVKQAIGK